MPFIVPLRYPRTQHIRLTERTKHGIEQEAGQAAARDGELAEAPVLCGQTMDSHELLKVAVQDGSGLTAKEAADKLAGQIGAQVVQVIGNRFVLYRKSSRNDIEHIRLVRE